jgi:hypothetical protein
MAKDGSIGMRFMLTRHGCAQRHAVMRQSTRSKILYGYTVCAQTPAWIKPAGSPTAQSH